MTKVATQFEKGLAKLQTVLDMVVEGTYRINEINGEVSKGDKVLKGSIGSEDGQRWYSIKNVTVQGQRLCYAKYHGLDALVADMVVKHLDDDKLNNGKSNLVQVNRNGWKTELDALREGAGLLETPPIEEVAPQAVAIPLPTLVSPIDTVKIYTGDELVARAVIIELNKGQTVKQVAVNYDLKESKVRDIRRGKSMGKVTADLRAE